MGVGCAEDRGRSRVLLVVAVEKQAKSCRGNRTRLRIVLMKRTLLVAKLKTLIARIRVRLILIPRCSQTMLN
jgi:hypothetical protein